MKLLVSPFNFKEAQTAIHGGAHIIDIKNPKEGSLGANFPWVIKDVKEIIPSGMEISATLGDLEFKPGTASLAAYGLASIGVDYIKGGFYGIKTRQQAMEMASSLVRAVEGFNSKFIIAGYADFHEIGSISPQELPKIAEANGADGVMIDTARKDGRGLLDHMSPESLTDFVKKAHSLGLITALAGSIKMEHIDILKATGTDIIGVRGLVCSGGDRVKGTISREKVAQIARLFP